MKLLIFMILASYSFVGEGCQMDDVNWFVPVVLEIKDTERGVIFSRNTSNILAYENVIQGGLLESGPYFTVSLIDSVFSVATNDAYADYEENETAQLDSISMIFRCAGGGTEFFAMQINIIDTNNNDPIFKPSDAYEFSVAPPLAPGYLLTDCINHIIVRDVDLTTQRMVFEIEDNPYLEIFYDEAAATEVKSFQALLRTTSFIRSLPEPLQLRISATDVDETGDPARTSSATITIIADTAFELPTEPVFNQPNYFANYTEAHTLILEQSISLRQGFDDQVEFALQGEYSGNFEIEPDGNDISLIVVTPLSYLDILDSQILLVVTAEREHTSGASTTVIVKLPEEIPLLFEAAYYEGRIEDNILNIQPLILQQGYENRPVNIQIISDYESFFSETLNGNSLTISMTPLDNESLQSNNVISLQIVASNGVTSSTAIVSLEVIKEDLLTPVFEEPLYIGSYGTEGELLLNPMVLIQGYDSTVLRALRGEHETFFDIVENGPSVTLVQISPLTPDIMLGSNIILYLDASRPRTVGATASITITLPEQVILKFTQNNYVGRLEDDELQIAPMSLDGERPDEITLNILGDFNAYFRIFEIENSIQIEQTQDLPPEILEESFIVFEIEASSQGAASGTSTVVIELIKEISLPVAPEFEQAYYVGEYSELNGLDFQQTIRLSQGFDNTVRFTFTGDSLEWFEVDVNDNELTLVALANIPSEELQDKEHFILVITAENSNQYKTTTTIVLNILKEQVILKFMQNNYVGRLEDNELQIAPMSLDGERPDEITLNILGDFNEYFRIFEIENSIQIEQTQDLPPEILEESFIVFEIEASSLGAASGTSTVVIELIKEISLPVAPEFEQAYYVGEYSELNGLDFQQTIRLSQGFDDTVRFTSTGDSIQWFDVDVNDNELTLVALANISSEELQDKEHFILVITAENSNQYKTTTTIVLNIMKETPETTILGFEQVNYVGALESSNLALDSITLLHGHSDSVQFTLHGDFEGNFVTDNQGPLVTVTLLTPIPEESLLAYNFIVLELRATAPQAVAASTTIVLRVVRDTDPVIVSLNQVYYSGVYNSELAELSFDHDIYITEGNDGTVAYDIEGDDGRWFQLEAAQNNVQRLILQSPLPTEVLQNMNMLVFIVTATKAGANTARSTVAISLSEAPETTILGFEQVNYVGTLESSNLTLDSITLLHGHSDSVQFTLHGDFEGNFVTDNQGPLVTVTLLTPIPEESLLAYNFIVLELRATAPQAVAASTTIVLRVVRDTDPVIVSLNQVYYSGVYNSELAELSFDHDIYITEGNDGTVAYDIEGDDGRWFQLEAAQNNVQRLILQSPLPTEVLQNMNMLVFIVTATKAGANTARSTVAISLSEAPETTILGFEQVNYVGTLESSNLTLDSITLLHGHSDSVQFTLHGDFEGNFVTDNQGPLVTVTLLTPIPEESLLAYNFIVLELRATAPQAVAASTTIVLRVVRDTDPVIVSLNQVYYSGVYNSQLAELSFDHDIYITEGNDGTVAYDIEGDDGRWFQLEAAQNNVQRLILQSPLPTEVLQNMNMLVFIVTATKAGANTARSTVAISLSEAPETTILGFEQVNYVGTLESSNLTLDSITLLHGHSDSVQFTLHGDFEDDFVTDNQGPLVTVTLLTPIPEESLLAYNFIVLELRATAPQAVAASTTIVLRVVRDTDPVIVSLNQVYYSGVYNSELAELSFDHDIYITEGNDGTVAYDIEGDDGRWFQLEAAQNNVQRLILQSPLPTEVLQNMNMLLFIVTATKAGANTARSTVAISLSEAPETTILGFEQVNYVGTLESSNLTLDSITLLHGHSDSVQFTLHGDFEGNFVTDNQGPLVTVTLLTPIPEESLLAYNFIVLELRATAPQAVAASTTIVLRVVRDTDPVIVSLNQVYYSGVYNSELAELSFDHDIYITEGNDGTVAYDIEGDDGRWFQLEAAQNNVQRLILQSPLPTEVLQNMNMLLFIVTATKAGANTARSTVAISLLEAPETTILGFEQVNYVGTLESSNLTLDSITLLHGHSDSVQFTLHGDFEGNFVTDNQGPLVTVTLLTPIPEESLLAYNFIVLELRATAPQAVAASTTIVLRVVRDTDPVIVSLNQVYYSGVYNSELAELSFDHDIYITEGNDGTVAYDIEGDDGRWFQLEAAQNNVQRLILQSPLPTEVLQNMNMLLFIVTATKAGANTARSTVAISLLEAPETTILGFEQVNYVGTLESSNLTLDSITLLHGHSDSVQFTLHGDFEGNFVTDNQGPLVTVTLLTPIPEESLLAYNFIVLELRATAPQAVAASTTIVLRVVRDTDPVIVSLNQVYYSGVYNSELAELSFDHDIYITEGNDGTVAYDIEGDDGRWFQLEAAQNNVQRLILQSPLPTEVLQNMNMLLFIVTATKAGANTARSTVAISLLEAPETTILGFEQVNYVGTLESSNLTLDSITLLHGHSDSVQFTLHGDFEGNFVTDNQGPLVTVTLLTPIPEESLLAYNFIVLELRATAPQAVAASTTIVLRVVRDTDPVIVSLNQVYYSGVYNSELAELSFDHDIYITEGNDGTVAYDIEGDDGRWFQLEAAQNNVQRLILQSPLPTEVLQNMNMLVFIVTATKAGANTARSTVAISLSEAPETTILGFEQVNYVGTLESSNLTLDSITLLHGHSDSVQFTLHGDFEGNFVTDNQGPLVTVTLLTPIPEESLLAYNFIVLELRATAPQAVAASTTIVLRVVRDTDPVIVSLNQVYYSGVYNSELAELSFDHDIYITEGNDGTVAYDIEGDDGRWFQLEAAQNNVQRLILQSPLPTEVLQNMNMLVFIVTATKAGANTARSTVAISLSEAPETTILGFEQVTYVGTLESSNLTLDSITLLHGHSDSVQFTLHGDFEGNFVTDNQGPLVTVTLLTPIPEESLLAYNFIVLELRATAPQAVAASTTIVLRVVRDTDPVIVSLNQVYYSGVYNSELAELSFDHDIYITEGNDGTVAYDIEGDDGRWFQLEAAQNNVQRLILQSPLPTEVLQNMNMLVFIVTATKAGANTARSTVAISLSEAPETTILGFEQVTYVGTLESSNLTLDSITLLHGHSDSVQFTLHGDFEDNFVTDNQGPLVTVTLLTPIPEESLLAYNFIVLELRATAPQAVAASTTIVLRVVRDTDPVIVSLNQVYYSGVYNSELAELSFDHDIYITEGNDGTVAYDIEGDDGRWFQLEEAQNNVQRLILQSPLPAEVLQNMNMLVFIVTATKTGANTARSTVAISLTGSNVQSGEHLVFSEIRYIGNYSESQLIFNDMISLIEGYDEMVEFLIDGDGSEYFELVSLETNRWTLRLPEPLPDSVTDFRYFIDFNVIATRPGSRLVRSSIFIHISEDTAEISPAFEKVLYEGIIQAGQINHEEITIRNFNGDTVQLIGEYGSLFRAAHDNGVVEISVTAPLTIPASASYLLLEMQADAASAVLVLEVDHDTGTPVIPSVSFLSDTYAFNVDVAASGLIGKVEAAATNGEALRYSLVVDNGHLQERIFVNNEGEIHLSAPANSGVYSFQMTATTIFTNASATAAGHLNVEAVTVIDCDDETLVMPPLIVLDRDEESEHRNLVVLDSTRFEGCQFNLNNRWPMENDWLYVDNSGLHTRIIDREDSRIAFMALSQVQVELILECEGDHDRAKRSISTKHDRLGPYDYGMNKWILTDSILYNSRRSFVNLIVNDINDNPPIFIGKENEPLVVGYPVSELEHTILPRSIAELQATDADIGENAALVYWTSDEMITVSPSTGFVHVRNLDSLEDGQQLTVHATDRSRQGTNTLTGSINLIVRLLNVSHIAVVTVKDTFLEDEAEILTTLSTSLGYEVKLLRSVIISEDSDASDVFDATRIRKKRNTNASGTSMQLYVYGIDNSAPVEVVKLVADIQSSVLTTDVMSLTLEEHLNDLDACVISGNDTGLLVATIVLSVLLFILIVAIAVWFFLIWKKNRVYEEFSDQNSLASSIESVEESAKPEQATKPRLNIQELKRSERRLQEMLDAPFEEVSVEANNALKKEDTKVNLPIEAHPPIIIQSIDKLKTSEGSDDEDEFGEIQRPRRKSVVTFNENVEKIIHVQDTPELDRSPQFEVYKL